MTTTKYRWGRTSSGRSPWPGALAIGFVATGALAALAAAFEHGPRAWLLPLCVAVMLLPILTVVGWAILVDRSTLKGAVARPEESVENRWLDVAIRGGFQDVVSLLGLSLMAMSLIQPLQHLLAKDVLLAVLLFTMADLAVRYQLAKRADA